MTNDNYKGLTAVQREFMEHLQEYPKGLVPFQSGYPDYWFGTLKNHCLTERTVRALEAKGLIDVRWSNGWYSSFLVIWARCA